MIIKLIEKDYQKSLDKKDYVEIGNLLFMNQDSYVKGSKEIEIEGKEKTAVRLRIEKR